MRVGFYQKVAFSNIKKNAKFFVPRILTEAGLLGCFYIIITLAMDSRLKSTRGGAYIPVFMMMGAIIVGLLSFILMLYTNSFLMKQRKREFGLYNVLGMEKRHVGRVLFHESFISSIIGTGVGIVFGILFYKLATLIICKMFVSDIIMGFYYVKPTSIIPAAVFFLGTDLLTYIINRITIARMKPVNLLKSNQTGEKEPKVKWPLLVLGLVSIGVGYYIAITTDNALSAINLFFAAVILVIVGTYFLFVSGSIFVLKQLKRNRRYYYDRRHMPVVSGLLYRMKQNAVGLASIAILSTCVLVMMSTTISLYGGINEMLEEKYPPHYQFCREYDYAEFPKYTEDIEKIIDDVAGNYGVEVKEFKDWTDLEVAYKYSNGEFISDRDAGSLTAGLNEITILLYITADDYNRLTGNEVSLAEDEILMYSFRNLYKVNKEKKELFGEITISDENYTIAGTVGDFPVKSEMSNITDCYGVVVANSAVLNHIYQVQLANYGEYASRYDYTIGATYDKPAKLYDIGFDMQKDISIAIQSYIDENGGVVDGSSDPEALAQGIDMGEYDIDSIWESRNNALGMNGTFLFLGLLLGMIFLFATALIIYYKQISEGYEDRQRFQIMEKIGMSSEEVKRTIREQILLVFFLPIVVAAIHLIVAFRLLANMLHLLLLANTGFFAMCAAIVFVIFVVVYIMIYSITAKTYYKIVH